MIKKSSSADRHKKRIKEKVFFAFNSSVAYAPEVLGALS
jgi:hypothetical protein